MADPTLAKMRVDYHQGSLDEADVAADPIEQFARWFEDAKRANVREPNAMTLATADAAGRPSARIVLLKDFDARGFAFYTNYESRKAHEIAENPRAALVFFWADLERQVRVEGTLAKVDRAESAAYFAVRPRAAQLGAHASHQSATLASREVLEARQRELDVEFAGRDVPLPDRWGGYRLSPEVVEFWQGGASRLHDRLRYRRQGDAWSLDRLSP